MTEKKWHKTTYYDSVRLDEYKGKVSLVAGSNGQNDAVYDVWQCAMQWKNGEQSPKLKQGGSPLAMPRSVILGESREEARRTLQEILKELA